MHSWKYSRHVRPSVEYNHLSTISSRSKVGNKTIGEGILASGMIAYRRFDGRFSFTHLTLPILRKCKLSPEECEFSKISV